MENSVETIVSINRSYSKTDSVSQSNLLYFSILLVMIYDCFLSDLHKGKVSLHHFTIP